MTSRAADRLRLYTFAAPMRFYRLAGAALPWLWAVAIAGGLAGLYVGFFVAPTDATQGESYRILFIHVPAAWLSMILYLAMAFWAAIGWAFNARMASVLARAIAPTGAMFTVLALVTGALRGQPPRGAWGGSSPPTTPPFPPRAASGARGPATPPSPKMPPP